MTEPARRYFDADSHVLEPQDWLVRYADPGVREQLKPLPTPIAPDAEQAAAIPAGRSSAVLDNGTNWGRGYAAFGAWDPY